LPTGSMRASAIRTALRAAVCVCIYIYVSIRQLQ
jgi:hypothetical protein